MILITGATGFLGAEVTRQLIQSGEKVRCLRRATSVIPGLLLPYKNQIEWVEGDLLDLASLEDAMLGVSQVYHCAAFVSFDPADKKKLIKINIDGTANVVNACLPANIRLLHVSSVAALGEVKPGEQITENTWIEDTGKLHAYAVSKYESEMEVWRGIAEGLDALIVNPSLIIGKNSGKKSSGQIFEMLRNGLSYYPSGTVGIVDAEDVARSMIMLMNSSASAERYIISATNISYKELFAKIANFFGQKTPAKEAKPWMLELAWRVAAVWRFLGFKATLTKDAARSSSKKNHYSNQKTITKTGLAFKPLDGSIREVCEALIADGS